jgi:hypothetical protein
VTSGERGLVLSLVEAPGRPWWPGCCVTRLRARTGTGVEMALIGSFVFGGVDGVTRLPGAPVLGRLALVA